MSHDNHALAHSLKPRHVTMISLGGIIGAGIFVGSSAAINIAGPSVIFTYMLCGLLVYTIMRMLGEMAMSQPGVGTFTGYATLGLGPWAGFTSAWLYFYFWIVTIAIEAIAGANILLPIIHGPIWAISSALIFLAMMVNLLSVRLYGEFEFWFAALKVATIVGFVLLGLGWIIVFGPGTSQIISSFQASGGLFPLGAKAVFSAVPVVMFSMMGGEVATIAAVETEDPARNVVRAGRTVTLRILFFYVGSIGIIMTIVPWSTVIPGNSPFTQTLTIIGVPGVTAFMTVVIFTAIASCLNSATYITSRMLFEMAGRGDSPAMFRQISKNQVPSKAIVTASVLGFLVVLSSIISPKGVFVFLIQSSGAIILLVYLIIAASQIALRRRLENAGRALQVKVWLFPWVSYACIIGIILIFILMAEMSEQLRQVSLSVGMFAATVMVYFLWKKPSAKPDFVRINKS